MGHEEGSSGCPIILMENHKVVGIHLGEEKAGLAIFMKDVMEEISALKIEKQSLIIKILYKLKKNKCIILFIILLFLFILYVLFKSNNNVVVKYKNGNILYDGQIKDDKFDGNGKLYYENGNIQYNGTFNRGKYDELGTLYYKDKNGTIFFQGLWDNGMKSYGTLYYENGRIMFEGSWDFGKRSYGTLYYKNGYIFYKGGFNKNEEFHGNDAKLYYENGNIQYYGTFKNDELNGFGIYYYEEPNGTVYYKGYYKGNKKDGKGIIYSEDNLSWLDGTFTDDIVQKGIIYKKDKNGEAIIDYDGGWKDGKPDSIINFLKHKVINMFN